MPCDYNEALIYVENRGVNLKSQITKLEESLAVLRKNFKEKAKIEQTQEELKETIKGLEGDIVKGNRHKVRILNGGEA